MPDYAKLAEAMGGVGMVVTKREDVRDALEQALALDRTVVVDVRVDPSEHCFPMIPAGAAALDMIEYADTLAKPETLKKAEAL
jgi:acetolactate synthase-1/2/3 large subunit